MSGTCAEAREWTQQGWLSPSDSGPNRDSGLDKELLVKKGRERTDIWDGRRQPLVSGNLREAGGLELRQERTLKFPSRRQSKRELERPIGELLFYPVGDQGPLCGLKIEGWGRRMAQSVKRPTSARSRSRGP